MKKQTIAQFFESQTKDGLMTREAALAVEKQAWIFNHKGKPLKIKKVYFGDMHSESPVNKGQMNSSHGLVFGVAFHDNTHIMLFPEPCSVAQSITLSTMI